MGAEIHQCFASYAAMSQTEGLGEISQGLLLVLEKLKQFAGGSVKRCKDKNLEEAHQLLSAVSKGLWVLDRSHVLPLVKCVLALQMETTNNSSSFLRLEKLVATLSEGDEALVSEQLNQLMSSLVEHKEALSPGSLQTVCMFIEESMLGRSYWQNNLMQLLKCIAATFDSMSQEQISRNEQWCYITVKTCLQLFKLMPKEVAPLVWDGTGDSKALQSILGSLVHIVMGKAACRDIRMLAGTAVSMLVNTAPEPCRGAAAVLELYHLLNAGEGQFGMLSLPSRAWDSDGLERLVLTRGLLASCKREILSCLLDGTQQQVACSQWEGSQLDNTQRRDGQAKGWTRKNAGLAKACLLLDVLLPAVLILMEKQKDCLYYCFQVFTLWLQRFQESLDEIWKVKESRILDGNSRLLQELTQFLWNNAESPVEGVSDFIHSSFQHLLEIYSLECDHFKDTERPLYEQFLQRVLCLPWQAKARYVPLRAILPYLGPGKVLDTYKDLPQHLLSCLSTNHLCPAASDLYKTILQQQRKVWTEEQEDVSEEELARKWGQHWLPTLTCGLTSSNSFLQSNTSNYLLVWTLRLFPASYALLAEGFKGKDSTQIHAWVTLLNIQKTVTGVLPAGQETLERLSACLCAKEDNIRLAALSLLCSSPRTNQSLSVMDIQLLKEFLPLNLNCDSSSFRQFLQASVKKALVRLRDSSLAALRQRMKNKECSTGEDLQSPVVQAVDFVEWLLQLCASSLMSGSNFQRRKSALLLLAAVLETCTDSWSPERKKGQPPRNMAALLSRAKSKGCWDFFSRSNILMLLSCLQDSTNEIRELAAELLVSYFPPAFPESIAVALFERALEAVSSPRVPEAEAGAVMMKTVFQKSDTCTLKRILAKQERAVECQHLSFIEYLLGVLQVHISSAHRDLLQAAHSTPIHGVVLALRRCLLEVPAVVASMSEARLVQCWRDFLSRLVESVRDAVRLLLGMLQGKQASSCSQEAVAPSFADVGNAIGSLIQLGKDPGQEDEEDPILLSEEHSLVLTCCWVSVKEIGLLLGGLAEKILLLPPQVGCGPLLPLPVVKMASEGFQEILLRCRHWGAVEGCSVGFTKFCATLLSLPDLELQEVPKAILEQGLVLLSSPRSSSITRRAAGFPMLFLCILAGEGPTKSRPLLTHGCQTLLALASMPLSQDWNQTLDLPQVSAVHVLQTLVRGSELGAALRQYVTPMVILVLKALDSPSWAMRNAAIQLFGALTVRLLGQKRSRGDSHIHGGVSPEALFSLYPQLKHILLEELSSAVAASGELRDGKFPLCPALYAILTFLAKFQPSADGVNSSSRCFLEPLIGLAGNPIYAARVMAARALVPLVPAAEYGTLLLRLTSDLPQPGDAFSHNALHGQLLQIESVLAHALRVNHLSPDTLLSVTCQLEDRLWLVTSVQQCPLVRLAYLQVVSFLVGTSPCDFAQRVWVAVRGELDHSKPVEKAGLSHVQVGSVTFCQLAVRFLCNEGTRLASPETVHGVCSLLQKGSTDLQAAILTWVIEMEDRKNPDLMKELLLTLWEKLEEVLKGRTDCTFLKLYLEAFVHLNSNQCQFVSHKPFGPAYAASRGILLSMVESGDFSPEIQCHALCVLASLLTAGFEDLTLLERWCFIIERCSEPFSPEVLRMAAAKSLNIAGADMVWRAREDSSQSLCTMAVRLINVAISLLQDEDHEVRLEATIFASLVVQRQPPLGVSSPGGCALLHSNKGLVSLFHLLVEEFWVCPETFACLVHHLPSTDLSDTLADLEDKGAVSLYKEDEPNVYAEPAVLSQMLLPFLFWLLDRASASPRLWESIQAWLKATGPGLLTTLQHCMSWWSQDGSTSLHLKALGSQKMHVAVTALLVKAALVVHILEILEEKEQPSIEEIHYSSQDLKDTVLAAQKALAQHGMVVTVNVEIEQMGRQGYLGCVSVTS